VRRGGIAYDICDEWDREFGGAANKGKAARSDRTPKPGGFSMGLYQSRQRPGVRPLRAAFVGVKPGDKSKPWSRQQRLSLKEFNLKTRMNP
jgi:hypothetical protein